MLTLKQELGGKVGLKALSVGRATYIVQAG